MGCKNWKAFSLNLLALISVLLGTVCYGTTDPRDGNVRGESANTWTRDASQHADFGVQPTLERWQGDMPPDGNPHRPPQNYDAWRGPPNIHENPHPRAWYHRETYVKAMVGEIPNDRNDRAIRVATQWYQNHLGSVSKVMLITNDRENRRKAIEEGISAETVESYVKSLGKTELLDLLANLLRKMSAWKKLKI